MTTLVAFVRLRWKNTCFNLRTCPQPDTSCLPAYVILVLRLRFDWPKLNLQLKSLFLLPQTMDDLKLNQNPESGCKMRECLRWWCFGDLYHSVGRPHQISPASLSRTVVFIQCNNCWHTANKTLPSLSKKTATGLEPQMFFYGIIYSLSPTFSANDVRWYK